MSARDGADDAPRPAPGRRRDVARRRRRPASSLLVAIAAARSRPRRSRSSISRAKVERGEIRDVVDATGTVNAVITRAGRLAGLGHDREAERRFQLARAARATSSPLIDPQLFEGALQQATADLENAQANVDRGRGEPREGQGDAGADEGGLRARAARWRRTASGRSRRSTWRKPATTSARASVDAAAANVTQAKAQVSQKEAAVAVARTNLDYTVIRSPIDGIVVARNVDVGQTVAASLQAPTIFTIAQDLTKMQRLRQGGRVRRRPHPHAASR